MNFDPKKHLERGPSREELRRRRAQAERDAKLAAFVGPPAPRWHVYRNVPPGSVITIGGGGSLTDALRAKGMKSFIGVPITPEEDFHPAAKAALAVARARLEQRKADPSRGASAPKPPGKRGARSDRLKEAK